MGLNSSTLLSRATGMAAAVRTEPELQTRTSTRSWVMSWLIRVVEVAGGALVVVGDEAELDLLAEGFDLGAAFGVEAFGPELQAAVDRHADRGIGAGAGIDDADLDLVWGLLGVCAGNREGGRGG